jgi:hypothetical protein
VALQRSLHERQSCGFVSFLRNIALENLAFVIDSTPQIVRLVVDFHEHLIKVPAPLAKAAHPACPLPANISRKHQAEPVPPQTHGLVTDIDTALEQ